AIPHHQCFQAPSGNATSWRFVSFLFENASFPCLGLATCSLKLPVLSFYGTSVSYAEASCRFNEICVGPDTPKPLRSAQPRVVRLRGHFLASQTTNGYLVRHVRRHPHSVADRPG